MPVKTVWKVLRKRLQLRPYRLQLQVLKPTDFRLRAKFANDMLMQAIENFMSLHLNTPNARIWSLENLHEGNCNKTHLN
ncbi:hypothetical protein TNCV_3122181 [Trichonephila clavipes]|nr:hypothetical protein TNCV_3122181 [Trichonephila clavipes]